MIWREISSIALIPFSGSIPACAAFPIAFSVNRPMPFRAVFKTPLGSEGSSTSTAVHWLASASIRARDELLPTSSSLVRRTVTGRLKLPRTFFRASTAIHISKMPAFISNTPGPSARPPSILNGLFSISPVGQTVSVCPNKRMRPRALP